MDHVNTRKSREELISEIVDLRQRISELEDALGRADKFGKHAAGSTAPTVEDEIGNAPAAGDAVPADMDAALEKLRNEIAERRQAENALKESEETYRAFSDAAFEGILISHNGIPVDANKRLLDILGYEREELLKLNGLDVIHPDDRELVASRIKSEYEGSYPIKCICKDGRIIDAEVHGKPINYRGRRCRITAVHDITEKMRALEALKESEEKYYTLVENAPIVVWQTSREGRTSFISSRVTDIYGYTPGEIYEHGKDLFFGRIHPDDIDYVTRAWNDLFIHDTKYEVEYRIKKKDGNWMWLHDKAIRTHLKDDEKHAIGVFTDITERKRTEEKLLEKANIIHSAASAIASADLKGRVESVNPAFLKLWGFESEDEVLGRPFDEFWLVREKMDEIMGALLKGDGIWSGEIKALKKDGTTFDVSMSAAVVNDVMGRPIALMSTSADITERKQAEQEQKTLRAQVQYAQKLESLGILAGGIAHDFNNILAAILGNADLAMIKLAKEDPARRFIKAISKASLRAADLVKQMLAYSGKGRFIVEPVDLSSTIREMGHLLEVSIPKKVILKYDLAVDLPAIEGDASQIRQVAMNLITNAAEAIDKESGVVTLKTGVVKVDRNYLKDSYVDRNLAEGSYSYIKVSDTGKGMDEKTVARMFDPFFTTKFAGRGLGLAAVQGIIRRHKGAIKVDSEPGKGTTVEVMFPCSKRPVKSSAEAGTGVMVDKGRGGTILVIDDEEEVRKIAGTMLEEMGIKVLSASDGLQGIKIYSERSGEIALVLLDMMMPNLDGVETFRELRRINPEVKVVLMSGYNEQDVSSHFDGANPDEFIQKPFTYVALAKTIRSTLAV